jgi:hypothetical protein
MLEWALMQVLNGQLPNDRERLLAALREPD